MMTISASMDHCGGFFMLQGTNASTSNEEPIQAIRISDGLILFLFI